MFLLPGKTAHSMPRRRFGFVVPIVFALLAATGVAACGSGDAGNQGRQHTGATRATNATPSSGGELIAFEQLCPEPRPATCTRSVPKAVSPGCSGVLVTIRTGHPTAANSLPRLPEPSRLHDRLRADGALDRRGPRILHAGPGPLHTLLHLDTLRHRTRLWGAQRERPDEERRLHTPRRRRPRADPHHQAPWRGGLPSGVLSRRQSATARAARTLPAPNRQARLCSSPRSAAAGRTGSRRGDTPTTSRAGPRTVTPSSSARTARCTAWAPMGRGSPRSPWRCPTGRPRRPPSMSASRRTAKASSSRWEAQRRASTRPAPTAPASNESPAVNTITRTGLPRRARKGWQ